MKIIIDEDLGKNPIFVIEEYIPMKIVMDETKEPINFFSFSKEKKSLLEIAVGEYSGRIKKITLLLSKDYRVYNKNICMFDFPCEYANIKVVDYASIECEKFSTELFEDALKIILINKGVKKYIKIGRLCIGISNYNEIVEICVIGLSKEENKHIKKELMFQ